MMLCDATIRQLVADQVIGFDPAPQDDAYQPASVDLRLAGEVVAMSSWGMATTPHRLRGGWLHLAPGTCALACTEEEIRVPDHLVARVEGKSSWGRRFLQVHSTAGFIDPGFHGQITLELKNQSPRQISIPVGAYLAQISFEYLDAPAQRPYGSPGLGSHYQGQRGATRPC